MDFRGEPFGIMPELLARAEYVNRMQTLSNRYEIELPKEEKKKLKEEGKVTLTGFCTFTKQHKEARQGRNPRTGEKVEIPARNVVTVKVGSKLKEAVK